MKKTLKKWHKNVKDKDQLYLKLKDTEDGDVVLLVVNYRGEKIDNGSLLLIDNEYGVIMIPGNISEDIPLKKDIAGAALSYYMWQIRQSNFSSEASRMLAYLSKK